MLRNVPRNIPRNIPGEEKEEKEEKEEREEKEEKEEKEEMHEYNYNKKQQTYCGNNKNKLKGKRRGTRYECLRKGIGAGMHSSLENFDPNYKPIHKKSNIYCGNNNVLPQGYDRMGLPSDCLRKGFGVGQKIQYEKNNKPINRQNAN